jgi:intein-encoded DNA endonuclease-like protein
MVPRKVLSKEQVQKIIERYTNKESLLSIGKVFGVGQGVITRILKENGVTIRKSSEILKAFTEEQEDEVIEKYKKGMTAKEIASQFGLQSAGAVLKVLKNKGINPQEDKFERNKRLSDDQKKEIAIAYTKGETQQSLSRRYGVSDPTISKALKEQGVIKRTRSQVQYGDRRIGGVTDDEKHKMKVLYEEGKTTVEIAKIFGLWDSAIGRYLTEIGVKRRTPYEARGGVGEEDESKIVERYQNGESSVQIATDYNVYYSTILRVLRRRNCEIRENSGWGDTVRHALSKSGRFANTQQTIWYIYSLRGFPDYLKPGITNNQEAREQKSGGHYEEQIYAKEYGSREEAFFIEQAVLAETLEYADAPEELVTVRWNGFQEIRKMPVSDLERIFEFYNQELEEMGVWRFAAAYVPMTEAERQECLLRSSAE